MVLEATDGSILTGIIYSRYSKNPVFSDLSSQTTSFRFPWIMRIASNTLKLHKKDPSTDRYENNVTKRSKEVAVAVFVGCGDTGLRESSGTCRPGFSARGSKRAQLFSHC